MARINVMDPCVYTVWRMWRVLKACARALVTWYESGRDGTRAWWETRESNTKIKSPSCTRWTLLNATIDDCCCQSHRFHRRPSARRSLLHFLPTKHTPTHCCATETNKVFLHSGYIRRFSHLLLNFYSFRMRSNRLERANAAHAIGWVGERAHIQRYCAQHCTSGRRWMDLSGRWMAKVKEEAANST